MVFPSGEYTKDLMLPLPILSSVPLDFPVAASHKYAVLSGFLAVAMVFPSGEYAMEAALCVCSLTVVFFSPLVTSRSCTVLPAIEGSLASVLPVTTVIWLVLPLAMVFPSGAYANAKGGTPFMYANRSNSLPVCGS